MVVTLTGKNLLKKNIVQSCIFDVKIRLKVILENLFVKFLDQETAKRSFRVKSRNKRTCRPISTLTLKNVESQVGGKQ